MNLTKFYRKTKLARMAGIGLLAAGCLTACEGYDLADNTPDWLGSSIYDYLNDKGNYTNVVHLIDDLNYKEVLSKTGSKTLFVADDAAYARFYANNPWNVKSYAELTDAQKKMLLMGAMINNSCQVAYLSSTENGTTPKEGDCMRRNTSISLYDSVPIIKPEEMPDNPYWDIHKNKANGIVCFRDMTTAPMIHFIEAFLQNNIISNSDCDFLFNQKEKRQSGDANVNGINIKTQNIKCSNGFVHEMEEVLTPLPNMAELIHNNPEMSDFARLLDRYSAPYYAGEDATQEYNRIMGEKQSNFTPVDSVYQLRYFSRRSQGNAALNMTPKAPGIDPMPVDGLLKFDPGWNQFFSDENSQNPDVAIKENMGVMLVPDNTAMSEYFDKSVLSEEYASWDDVPDNVISRLFDVTMLSSLVASVPSKFSTVLNDANDELGIETSDVKKVYMACNGAVYMTGRVFTPAAYISVPFPTLIKDNLKIMNWAIRELDYEVYLHSQNSRYSLFVPTNEAFLEYLDPCSMKKPMRQIFRFHYDPNAVTEDKRVWASVWNYDDSAHVVLDSVREASQGEIRNRLKDILETHIVIGNVEDGNTYYKTKGGSVIKISDFDSTTKKFSVQGGGQIEQDANSSIRVAQRYERLNPGNGCTYQLDAPIMTSEKSVIDMMAENPAYTSFYSLLKNSSYIETINKIGNSAGHACGSTNISLFNTFQYTVLVPTNNVISKMHQEGKLPTWDMVDAEEDNEVRDSLKNEIEMFLKYHIIDNSFFIGQGEESGDYETSAYSINPTTHTLSYHKVHIDLDNNGLTVRDANGDEFHVVKDGGNYNKMAREYQFNAENAANATEIYTSSYAVIHQIDGAMSYK